MDERALLLGLPQVQSQHGTQLNEVIECNLSRVTDMKRPTAYATLDRLSRQGFVEPHAKWAGNRPIHRTSKITPAGEALFQRALREILVEPSRPTAMGDIGLMFLDALPPAEARACLERRIKQLDEPIAAYAQTPPRGHSFGVDLLIARVFHSPTRCVPIARGSSRSTTNCHRHTAIEARRGATHRQVRWGPLLTASAWSGGEPSNLAPATAGRG